MKYISQFWNELITLVLEMAPWLLFGFLIAGILHVFFPAGKINRILGNTNMKSVIRATLIGIPLPLCSCGVIPTGISIYRNGASKGAAISFLISTPQTGVDSIMVTYSMLGLPFAILRPLIALLTGITGGFITNKLSPINEIREPAKVTHSNESQHSRNIIYNFFRYSFYELMDDIAEWFVIGLLIAALIAVLIPDNFFLTYMHNDIIGMLIILAISIPLYVCATGSIPIAAVLMMKGLSPGAALIFLMAGPASNAATITVIGNIMGRRTLIIYLATLVSGAFLSGLFVDNFLPREWFTGAIHHMGVHEHSLLPYWLKLSSAIIITLMVLNIFILRFIKLMKKKMQPFISNHVAMNETKIFVKGMTCNHCKTTVENGLKELQGVTNINADLSEDIVTINAEKIDLVAVKDIIEKLGYKYDGVAK